MKSDQQLFEQKIYFVSNKMTESRINYVQHRLETKTISDLIPEFKGARYSFNEWPKRIIVVMKTFGIESSTVKLISDAKMKNFALK